ncbi:MAG: hypothetical protein RLZZ15_4464 [Verrucomicrobiota bacterium]
MASVADGKLEFAIQEEKDSRRCNSAVSLPGFLQTLERVADLPDVFAVGSRRGFGNGDSGLGAATRTTGSAFGRAQEWFHSTHEKSHLFGAYALSPFEPGRPCYALVWERHVGAFYRIDEKMGIQRFPTVLAGPGRRYGYLYYLADTSPEPIGGREEEGVRSGKVRALAGFGRRAAANPAERALFDRLLDPRIETKEQLDDLLASDKKRLLPGSPFVRCGVRTQEFKDLARKFSDELFQRFHDFAAEHLTEKLPLLIGGGCALNGEWNTRWRDSGLFADVFVPPCASDGGNAIGTAAEAQFVLTGHAKIDWSAFAGEEFVEDWPSFLDWEASPLSLEAVAMWLARGQVIAWVQGRYEIGPRALGNRSLLAAPVERATAVELNRIQEREDYRPIAAVCLREDAHLHFGGPPDNPHGMYAQPVKDPRLAAVAHIDGTARAQTVTPEGNPRLHALLTAFKAATGTGVLCHASLNFTGRGCINRTTQLVKFATARGLGVVVINDRLFVRPALLREPAGLAR